MNESAIFTVTHEGELNAVSSPQLKERIQGALADGHRWLVIDLARVPFIDSSGLSVLVGGLKAIKLTGGDMALAALQDQAATIFSITSAHRLFEIHPTVAAAEASLQARLAEG